MGEEKRVFWWEITKERNNSEDRVADGRMESEYILGRLVGLWSGFGWLRIGTSGGLLQMR
jgi:hypothetical protein